MRLQYGGCCGSILEVGLHGTGEIKRTEPYPQNRSSALDKSCQLLTKPQSGSTASPATTAAKKSSPGATRSLLSQHSASADRKGQWVGGHPTDLSCLAVQSADKLALLASTRPTTPSQKVFSNYRGLSFKKRNLQNKHSNGRTCQVPSFLWSVKWLPAYDSHSS